MSHSLTRGRRKNKEKIKREEGNKRGDTYLRAGEVKICQRLMSRGRQSVWSVVSFLAGSVEKGKGSQGWGGEVSRWGSRQSWVGQWGSRGLPDWFQKPERVFG